MSIPVSLSLGSNIDRYRHINAGLQALEQVFGSVLCSPVYESAAVGFDGSPFLNLVAIIETDKALPELVAVLKQIEDDHGRDRSSPKFSARTLDIDVVTYGDAHGQVDGIELPRDELFKHRFVSQPLADIWPERQVPGRNTTFAEENAKLKVQPGDITAVPFERRATDSV